MYKKKHGITSLELMTKKYYDTYDEEINKINSSSVRTKHNEIVKKLEFPLYDYNA